MSDQSSGIGDPDLEQLTEGDENESKEYKRGVVLREPNGKHKHEIAKQLVAFSNNGGGIILFGVDDSGQIDGTNLDEELSLGTLSKISRMRCRPPVQFSYEYISKEQDGDVFIVDVSARRSIPHAIVENSEGEIKKREYRLRAGDESRLVTDDELEWMFKNRLTELGDLYNCRCWVIFEEENIITPPLPDRDHPSRLEQLGVPVGTSFLAYFIDRLTDDDFDSMVFGEVPFGSMLFIADIVPFALLMSLSNVFNSSWYVDWNSDRNRYRRREVSPVGQDLPSTEIGLDDIKIEGKGASLSHLDFDPIECVKEWHDQDGENTNPFLVLPEGTNIKIELDDSLDEFPAIAYTESSLRLKNDNLFEFAIDSNWAESGRMYPPGHPESFKTEDEYARDTLSVQIELEFSTEYGVPEISDPYLREHQHFADKIKSILQEEWDADKHIKKRKEDIVFEMDGKLDKILNKLGKI